MNSPEPAHNPYQAPDSDVNHTDGKNYEIAGRLTRFLAALVDGVILIIVLFVPVLFLIGGWAAYVQKAAANGFLFNIMAAIIGFVGYLAVNGYFLAQNGQTIGKKLLGIRIVRTDGSTPDLMHIAFRRLAPIQFAGIIPFIGGFLPFIDALLIFRESNQCLHDTIADTIVVVA